ncbi:MAG: UDP-N-acetylmuramoyl-tripeptide--D-alanyl-D-alanine ligase [Gaiellales bacterium]|jgi:UDP-N-acetylmuramoyl-tripeptide--D-alanyl-D-alanine ligase|nr:UDP-N-acetylmuramoyl-tripeptide--D-alanyl-D-alanine ligase [Gaiellales bacterium]
MIPMRTDEIAAVTGGRVHEGARHLDERGGEGVVTGVSIDSRAVEPGDLFVALRGGRTDGSRFADSALASGAVAALVPEGSGGPGRIEVDDPVRAFGAVARAVRDRAHARVVGITGSTGKTSTKDILAALIAPHAHVVASRQNENNELGVPLTLCRIDAETEVAVVEMAMRGPGQIRELAEIAGPEIALVTTVGPVHLELLGTVERVAAAKAELLEAIPDDGVAVVPHGDALLEPHLRRLRCPVVTFGREADADVRLFDFRRVDGGGEAEIGLRGRTLTVPVNVTSQHNALNLTAAIAVYDQLGLPLEDVAAGARDIRLSRWRGEEMAMPGGGLLIADCYNANPASMVAALTHLVDAAGGRRLVAVLGDMAELGPDGPGHHQSIGELARTLGIDEVVAVGPLARGYGGTWAGTVEEAVERLNALLRPGDAVLVKGSRSMGLERVVAELAP